MREHRLFEPQRSEGRRRRPGYFQVTRPDELWHLDMTSVWVAEHGWWYLNARDRLLPPRDRRLVARRRLARRRGQHGHRPSDRRPRRRARRADAGHRQRHIVHQPRVPRPPGRTRDRAPPRRLPRPREPGVHRVLVRNAQAALRLTRAVRDPRPGPPHDRRLRRPLPPPAPLRAGLPHAARSRGHLETSRRPANPSGLTDNTDGVHAIRHTVAVERGDHKPPTCEHSEWRFAGSDSKRGASKWRCPTGECKPASVWIKADRLHPLVPRNSPRFAALYARRSSVEREFGRLKNEWALAPLRVRSIERVRLHADLTILAKLACALGRARAASLAALRVNQ